MDMCMDGHMDVCDSAYDLGVDLVHLLVRCLVEVLLSHGHGVADHLVDEPSLLHLARHRHHRLVQLRESHELVHVLHHLRGLCHASSNTEHRCGHGVEEMSVVEHKI